jgi:hypothetical protein
MTCSSQALSTPASGKPERQLRTPGAKVRVAIDLMVWQGHHCDEAAKLAEMNPESLYNAFRKHHVRAYYLAELGVPRESARARTFHRLEALRDQDENKAAAVKACQVLEQVGAQAAEARSTQQQVPGLVIVVQNALPRLERRPRPQSKSKIDRGTARAGPNSSLLSDRAAAADGCLDEFCAKGAADSS